MSLGLAAAPDLRRDLLGASGDAERFGGLGEQGSDRGERQLSRLLGGSDRTKAWENDTAPSSVRGRWHGQLWMTMKSEYQVGECTGFFQSVGTGSLADSIFDNRPVAVECRPLIVTDYSTLLNGKPPHTEI